MIQGVGPYNTANRQVPSTQRAGAVSQGPQTAERGDLYSGFVAHGLGGGSAGYQPNPAMVSLSQHGMNVMAPHCRYPTQAANVFQSSSMMGQGFGQGFGYSQGFGFGSGFSFQGSVQGSGFSFGYGYSFGWGQGPQVGAGPSGQPACGPTWGSGGAQMGGCIPWELPPPASLPPPRPTECGPPAGAGLEVSCQESEGWPAGTVTTAGGYRVYPEGDTNWNIYSPGQKFGDTPMTRVWGDPHVTEADGTRWDFTGTRGADGKVGNDFILGDGTRIFAETSSDKGHSVTTGLVITNGADRVAVTGMQGKPSIGQVTQDGYEWRAQHLAMSQSRESFRLAGNGIVGSDQAIQWVRERNGQSEGLITGARFADGRYDQVVDPNAEVYGHPVYTPAFGTPAWGNALRSQLNDDQALGWAQQWGPHGGRWGAVRDARRIHEDHQRNLPMRWPQPVFGGWNTCFGRPSEGIEHIELLSSYFRRVWS